MGIFSRVTEQPYKIPYYASLLRLLHDTEIKAEATEGSSLGKQILEDFWKGFQAFLDKLAWREARLCVGVYCVYIYPNVTHPVTDSFLRAFNSRESHFCGVLDLTFAVIHNCS